MMKHTLSEKWIKASIAGTIWAASEIVLGSFLHNLKVPFSGNILTGIGIIILISISHIWADRGLFWRAGLICALMKTMSPSAVIFGPMIAIFAEGILLEISVRILGKTLAGYLFGAMLAMSWNLFQKIANYIIFYGENIIEVYNSLIIMAQRQLNIHTDIAWLPIIVLLILFALFGFFTGVIGIVVGKKLLEKPPSGFSEYTSEPVKGFNQNAEDEFRYSVLWLFVNVLLIIGSFMILRLCPWPVWSAVITSIIILWSLRYRRAMRQLSKPKFWLIFVLITLITAFAFTKAQPGQNSWQSGLLTGIQMNFRAAVIIVGFSVLGTELYNPVIRNYFQKTSFKNLPLALELSAESLPSFITSIPDFKSLVRNPVSVFHNVISQADRRLSEIRNKAGFVPQIFIITGPMGSGKTTCVKKLIKLLRENNIHPCGILSEKVKKDDQITGYDLVNIETGGRKAFLRENGNCGPERIGKFEICRKGLAMGINILKNLTTVENRFIIIDEVGWLELQGKGWSECLDGLFATAKNHFLITVRDKFEVEVKSRWNLKDAVALHVKEAEQDFRHMVRGLRKNL